MNKMKLSIIIPAYNEEKRIGKTLAAYTAHFESLRKKRSLDYEIIIVINNTTDRTEEIVKKIVRKNKRVSYLNLKRGGKGYAVIEGFKNALKRNSDLIGFVDSDMSTRPEEYSRLAGKIGSYDGVIASRYLHGASVHPKPTFGRIFSSRIFNILVRALFFMPYRDTQCGAKIFKKQVLKRVLQKLITTSWAFDVDLLYRIRKEGFNIFEEPTKWSDSDYSKINFMRAGPFMALSVIRLRLLNSPFHKVVRLYDMMPSWLKIYNRFR
jgi:glycosyltransferase involved in cell wall biosynthesis